MVSSQMPFVILTFYFIAFELPWAMEMIEPIIVFLVSALCNFIQDARTAVSRETSIANSQSDVSHMARPQYQQLTVPPLSHDYIVAVLGSRIIFRHSYLKELRQASRALVMSKAPRLTS